MTLTDNIVIGFRYDEFNTHGLKDEEWKDLYEKQNLFFLEIFNKLKQEINNIVIFKYNDFSVVPRNSYIDIK